ncbi:hypothetical protein GHT06_017705 [Daphnia sinensis]|uniref:G-protein coupled receptors family 1 profile domain-containing protein n=1 Tax=Daphnia sinensis TaxID=1820382 RepID=A0AAD5L2U6_9CRUS|nr:hypothetical protein GHT06_017705 [Daphnia sinensis]
MLCRSDALANCQTVSSNNNDHGNGADNNYINETETSVGFSLAGGASSRTTSRAINDSDIAFDGGPAVSNWSDLFATAAPALAGPGANATMTAGAAGASGGFGAEVMIPLYSVIFILSVLGNILVIVTLTQNRRMRTVTNVFLLNLAIADLLLGVFCMPFTLIGQLLRDFIFGSFMCKTIPYFQAVSVAVGVWTLVAISLERYFAICRPLKSRIWQTRSHAYKMIVAIWILSLSLCLPVAVLSRLKPIRETGRHKCREEWPDAVSEKAYNLLLDVILLVLPLLIMGLAYWLIAARLWRGLRHETGGNSSTNNCSRLQTMMAADVTAPLANVCGSSCTVIRMLFVIVFEFFLCWAPLYMGPTEIALTQLLAYLSSCCNPITYCFMNEKFRNAFLSAFGCGPQGRGFGRAPNRSTDLLSASFNDSFNLGRRTTNKSK